MNISQLTLSEISDIRQHLLKASLSERQTIAWRVKWEELQQLETGIGQLKFKESFKYKQRIHPGTSMYPWVNRYSNSLKLAWRDHMYKDIRTDSADLELATEFRVSQDLFRRSSKEKREMLVKLQAWAEKNIKVQGAFYQKTDHG